MFRIISSKIHGLGLFTIKKYSAGQTIIKIDIDHLSKNPIQEDYYGRFINHSQLPCCVVDGYLLTAIRNIDENEELSIDYDAKKNI